jgi:GT2 family glycosyltransferase
MEELSNPNIKVLQQTENRGWEGGLVEGLKVSDSPYVIFMNDDTFVPPHQRDWLMKLLDNFNEPDVAAVGPSSNVVMGNQNIFIPIKEYLMRSKFLIGFCVAVRRSDLDAAGGIDESLPGGDDLDLSIRLRDLGKRLLIDRDVFIYHHGFKTGERVEGGPSQDGGWNSISKIEKTNHALINKHGLIKFLDLWSAYGL